MWIILMYIFSILGICSTALEIMVTVIKRTSLLVELTKFLLRYIFRRNRYYRNFNGLRIEYWLDNSKIVADEERARFNVQIENVSRSLFSEILFSIRLPRYMKMTTPRNIIRENLKDEQTVTFLDKINELNPKDVIRRSYELSCEGKELFVHLEITPYITAIKEINGTKERVGPIRLKGLSLKVRRKP